MNLAIRSLLALAILATVPLGAEDIALEEAPPVIFTIGGSNMGGTSVHGLAVGWSLRAPHRNVTISAHLTNGGGYPGYAGATAYLMRSIGPGTTTGDEVARRDFELPDSFSGMYLLFSGLELPAGDYWLVFSTPRTGPFSYASWVISIPVVLDTTKGARYLGTVVHSSASQLADYIPASAFHDILDGFGYQLEVRGERAGRKPRDR